MGKRKKHCDRGTHKCTRCLGDTSCEEYFKNDTICDACHDNRHYFPLGSTGGFFPMQNGEAVVL